MSAEQLLTNPHILDLPVLERIRNHLTDQNLNNLCDNALKAQVTPRMGSVVTEHLTERNLHKMTAEHVGRGGFAEAAAKPWTSLMRVTDAIEQNAESEMVARDDPASPYLTNTLLRFKDNVGLERFSHFFVSALAGIPNPHQPHISRDGPRTIVLHNLAYADGATFGRLATGYMSEQYRDMGSYRRGFIQRSIQNIYESGMINELPPELRERAERQAQSLGAATLLSSGGISILGTAMRKALIPADELQKAIDDGTSEVLLGERLAIQRPFDQRPYIEARTKFLSRYASEDAQGIQMPISRTTMGATLKGQVSERYYEYKKTVDNKDWAKAMQDIWDLATGLGASQGVGAVLRALVTVTTATGISLKGKYSDQQLKRMLQKQINEQRRLEE